MRLLHAIAALALLAGCNAANNGQYQTPARGGWDNFRAEAPADAAARGIAGG